MNKKPISIPEAFNVLSSADLPGDRQKEILDYTERFHHLSTKDARNAMKELKKMIEVPDLVLVKLIDLTPRTKEEITSILTSFNLTLPEEKLNSVLDYFSGLLD